MFNASPEAVSFLLPPRRFGQRWTLELSTSAPEAAESIFEARAEVALEARSLVVLRRP
jgi:pullulanase/glycogen debranching enzyme